MPLVVFKDNQRISALILRFFMLGASMSYFFLMPQALQKVFGFSPLMASISFLPLTVIQFIVSLYIPRLTARFSNTSVLISGVVNTFHQIGGAVGLAFISTMINGLKGADVMIDQAQFWMVVLAIIMTVAAINILRGKHE